MCTMGIIRQLTSRNGKIEPRFVKLAVRWALPESHGRRTRAFGIARWNSWQCRN